LKIATPSAGIACGGLRLRRASFQLAQTRSRTGLMHLFSSSSFLFPFSFTSSPSSFIYSPSLSRQASP
jgi:hypothetical protein